jgi:hypothetical protein
MHHRASEVKRNGGQTKKIKDKIDGTLFWKYPPEDRHIYGLIQKNLF